MKKTILSLAIIIGVMMLLLTGCASTSTDGNTTTQVPQFVQTTTQLKPIVIQIEVTNPNWQSQLAQYNHDNNPTGMTIVDTSEQSNGQWLKRAQLVDPNAVPYFFYDQNSINHSNAEMSIIQKASIVISKNIAIITIYQPSTYIGTITLYQYNQAINKKFFAIVACCLQNLPLPSWCYVQQSTSNSSNTSSPNLIQSVGDTAQTVNNLLQGL